MAVLGDAPSNAALAETYGGTGIVTYAQGDIIVADGADSLVALNLGTDGYFLKAGATDPAWAEIAWDDVSKTGSDLADLATRAYSDLTGRPGDDDFNTLSVASPNTADDNDYILIYDDSATAYAKMTRATFLAGMGGNPGGSASEVQYRVDASTFGGDANFQFDSGTDTLTLTGTLTPGAGNNLVIKLGDAVGTNYISFTDSADAEVARLDSDGKLQLDGAIEIDGDLDHDGSNIGFFGTAPKAQATGWAITNRTVDRDYDCNALSLHNLADAVATLIEDLIDYGLIGGTVGP